MSDAKIYEHDQGMKWIPGEEPLDPESLDPTLTKEERSKWAMDHNRARQTKIQKRKQNRVRNLLAALNRLSSSLFATISVAKRQITVLQHLHSVFLTSYRTKAKEYQKGYPLRRNPFHRNVATIPILSENPEQIWPNALDTINEVVRERESFIMEVKELVENMDIRGKIV